MGDEKEMIEVDSQKVIKMVEEHELYRSSDRAKGKLGKFNDMYLKGSKAFKGKNLSGAIFVGADLSGVDFSGCNLERAILFYADLRNADFSKANLKDADITHCNSRGANYSGADLSGSLCFSSKFEDCNFSNANASEVLFTESVLSGSIFKKSNISYAIFKGADVAGVTFDECIIDGAKFTDANIGKADFVHTELVFQSKKESKLKKRSISNGIIINDVEFKFNINSTNAPRISIDRAVMAQLKEMIVPLVEEIKDDARKKKAFKLKKDNGEANG